ncbi:MAG: P27 family phage terminase small subunit [Planctomycetota bacterium]|nr:P27 family phage terminase small subunit [Planctomycetota bacterium]
MKLRGRPRIPVESHIARGTYRKDRHGLPASAAPSRPLRIPPSVATNPDAAALWRMVNKNLAPDGVLKAADAAKLEGLCRWYGLFRRCMAAVERLDALDPDAYRLLIQASMAWRAFDSAAGEFGLSPASRARLKLPAAPAPETNGKGRFFRGGEE